MALLEAEKYLVFQVSPRQHEAKAVPGRVDRAKRSPPTRHPRGGSRASGGMRWLVPILKAEKNLDFQVPPRHEPVEVTLEHAIVCE